VRLPGKPASEALIKLSTVICVPFEVLGCVLSI
jgi:hypothetical protein